jgi:membrane-associated phospholipid phosphatase
MGLTVTVTGNHYFVDSLAGASLATAALLAMYLYRRLLSSRRQHALI